MAQVLSEITFLLTSISIFLTGMNFVLFLFCVYVLWGQKSKSRRLLLFSSTLQFSLCLAQVILFIVYLSVAYTFHASNVEAYFRQLSGFALPCYIIYIINNVIQELLVTWRIYIIYGNNLKVCIPSIILLLLQVGFAGATARGAATLNVDANRLHIFSLVTISLIVAVNVWATLLISLRLWTARQNANAILSVSKYKSTILIVVECGALMTICTLAMLILHAVQRPVGIAGLGVTTQAATMAPLLIVARYGKMTRDIERVAVASQTPLSINVIRTEDTQVDTAVDFNQKKRSIRSDAAMLVYPGGDHPKPFCDA